MMTKEIESAWIMPITELPENPYNFFQNITVNGDIFVFTWNFYADKWQLWVTFSDGSKREAGIYPNTLSWSGFSDYGLLVKTDLEEIGQDSLPDITVYLIKWRQ